MICNKCGNQNEFGVNFCVHCGNALTQPENVAQNVSMPNVSQQVVGVQVATAKKTNNFVKMLLDGLNNLKNYLLKPLESVKDSKTEDLKSVAITGGILSVLMVLVNLIMTMVSSLRSASYDFWTGKVSYSFSFSNLGNLDYLSLIFKNLLIYVIAMLAIAGIFYIGSLIVKKDVKFTKFLSIVFIAAVPFFIGNVVITSILNLIYTQLAVVAMIISTIYSVSIFAYLINNEVKLDNMIKIYYNAACYSTVILVIYFIVLKGISSAISGIGSNFGF